MHLDELRAIQLVTDTLADDFCWENKIIENVVVHRCQGTASWSLLLVWIGTSTLRLGKDFAFGAEHDMTAREFLLQLADEADLDFLESLLLGNWNVDDDSLKCRRVD